MVSDHSTFDSSPSPRGRSPSRSPSFRPESPNDHDSSSSKRRRHDDFAVEVCKDLSRVSAAESPDDHDSSSSKRRRHDDFAVEVCKDFTRNACVEAECKFSHPRSLALSLSMVPGGSHLDSPLPRRRKRRRSPSQSPSSGRDNHDSSGRKRWRHDELSVEVCKDFIRSACRRAETECKFAHPHSAVTIERDMVMACADSLRNKCFRGRTCRYFHPPPQIQESILKATGMEDPKVPVVCKDFIRGRCLRSANECRFAHHSSIDECAVICQDFLRGRCERKSCRYSHILIHVVPPALQHYGASVVPPIPQLGNGNGSIPLCRDFLKNACNRDSCKYAHPISQAKALQHYGASVVPPIPQLGNGNRSIPLCRDFLKNACNRDSCKYAHPISQAKWHGALICSSPPQPGMDQDILPACRDFLKNACHRDSCKYAHPNSQTKIFDNQVEVCRDFRRGLCHRTICHFYHPLAPGSEKESSL